MTNTDKNSMLNLAKEITSSIDNFYLGGGTAIMLKYDHRKSDDLDFFNEKEFSFNHYRKKLNKEFYINEIYEGTDNLDLFINNIKISLVFFPFPNIKNVENVQGIPIASDFDLLLNKIYVSGRRIESKDPFDIAWLWREFGWDTREVKSSFEKKFPGQSFEIFFGAAASIEDYPDLKEKEKNFLLEKADEIDHINS
ncbi:MAG: nucleotidyl transferase AbiEii/AbiGii toxin family protein [Flavobacteriales bacterium]